MNELQRMEGRKIIRQQKELIEIQSKRITRQEKTIDELLIENKGYKDAIERQNKYIESNRTAIERFDESNRGN